MRQAKLISILVALLSTVQAAEGASFGVSPTLVELNAAHRIGVITLHNQGDATVFMQIRVCAWSQENGEDRYEDSRELLATPPVFEVPAGADQVIRVALRHDPDTQRESSFRVFIREVPTAVSPGVTGLNVSLQLGIPVFVAPAVGSTPPTLQWRIQRSADGTLRVEASNHGSTRVRVQRFDLDLGDGKAAIPVEGARYVLAGSEVHWQVTAAQDVTSRSQLGIRGSSDQGDFAVQAAISSP